MFGTIAINNDEANQAIDDTTGKAEDSGSRIPAAFGKIAAAVGAAFTVDKIVEFGKACVDVSAEVSAEQSAFEQIMGAYTDSASQKVQKIADATGMVSTRLTPYMTSMTAKFKGLGYDIDDATTLASDGLNLAADASAFWDMSLDDSMSHLNSFINGSYEGGEAIGLFANDTQMAAYAVQEGIVASTAEWSKLDEATKQATRMEYAEAMYAQSGATGQAAKESEQYANVQANLAEKVRQFQAAIGEPILQNIVLPAMSRLSDLVTVLSGKLESFKTYVSNNKDQLQQLGEKLKSIAGVIPYLAGVFATLKAAMMIKGAVTAFQEAKLAVSLLKLEAGGASIAQASLNGTMTIGQTIVALFAGKMTLAELATAGMTKAQKLLNAAMKANKFAIIITIIAALVAAFIYLWKNCEGFRNFWIKLWDKIKDVAGKVVTWFKETWGKVSDWFKETWDKVSTVVSEAWETIKNVVKVGLMFIGALISAAFQIITLPFRFIWENCKEYVFAAWDAIKEKVTTAINAVKDVITTVWNAVSGVFSTVWNGIKNVMTTVWNAIVSAVTTYINNVKNNVTTVFNAVKGVVTTIWNAIKSAITGPLERAKTAVSNTVNGIKNTVSSVFNSIKSTASNIWNNIKTAITRPIENARNAVKSAIDRMKSYFHFSWSLPKLKLPHVSIKGSFSLNPPSVPSFGISWYKRAYDAAAFFTRPTVLGTPGGLKGFGDGNGGEFVTGQRNLSQTVENAVQARTGNIEERLETLTAMLAEFMPQLIENSNKQIVMNTGVLVGELAGGIDTRLGDINRLRERGR